VTKFQMGEIEQDLHLALGLMLRWIMKVPKLEQYIRLDVARKIFAIVPPAEARRSSRKGGAALLGGEKESEEVFVVRMIIGLGYISLESVFHVTK